MENVKILCILFVTIIILSGCSGSDNSFRKIAAEDISEITVHDTQTGASRTLTDDEISTFVSYYNDSTYRGKSTGNGGTDDFGAEVKFTNNDDMQANQFVSNNMFEVYYTHNKKLQRYYIYSPELYQFLSNIATEL